MKGGVAFVVARLGLPDLGVLWVQALGSQLRFQRTLDGSFHDDSVGELASQPDTCPVP